MRRSGTSQVIAKVVEAADADFAEVRVRVQTIHQLAELDPEVCSPIRHRLNATFIRSNAVRKLDIA